MPVDKATSCSGESVRGLMMRPLLDQDEDWPIAATLPTHFVVRQSCSVPHRTVRRLARDEDPCRVSTRGPKRKKHLQAVEGSACQSWMGFTDLELKELTGFRDQVRTLVCARYSPR